LKKVQQFQLTTQHKQDLQNKNKTKNANKINENISQTIHYYYAKQSAQNILFFLVEIKVFLFERKKIHGFILILTQIYL